MIEQGLVDVLVFVEELLEGSDADLIELFTQLWSVIVTLMSWIVKFYAVCIAICICVLKKFSLSRKLLMKAQEIGSGVFWYGIKVLADSESEVKEKSDASESNLIADFVSSTVPIREVIATMKSVLFVTSDKKGTWYILMKEKQTTVLNAIVVSVMYAMLRLLGSNKFHLIFQESQGGVSRSGSQKIPRTNSEPCLLKKKNE
jgi:hypothetical protein